MSILVCIDYIGVKWVYWGNGGNDLWEYKENIPKISLSLHHLSPAFSSWRKHEKMEAKYSLVVSLSLSLSPLLSLSIPPPIWSFGNARYSHPQLCQHCISLCLSLSLSLHPEMTIVHREISSFENTSTNIWVSNERMPNERRKVKFHICVRLLYLFWTKSERPQYRRPKM